MWYSVACERGFLKHARTINNAFSGSMVNERLSSDTKMNLESLLYIRPKKIVVNRDSNTIAVK